VPNSPLYTLLTQYGIGHGSPNIHVSPIFWNPTVQFQGTTTGNGHTYVIQLEFSNAANNCVAQ
jgi:hypothetical protein